jgi:hypothetical protein
MNYKHLMTCALALGVTSATNAAQAPARDTPDFVFTVPMNLSNIPGEVHTVVVWCEALNATYGRQGEYDPRDPNYPQNEKLLQFRAGPRVIASTGAIMIPVKGHPSQTAGRGTGGTGDRSTQNWNVSETPKFKEVGGPGEKPIPSWSVERIEVITRNSGGKPIQPGPGGKFSPQDLANLPMISYMIVPKGGAATSSSNAAVALFANTTGATDPALGTAFACHMGFKATALIDGKQTEFDIFAGPGSYESMPDETSKDGKFADGKGDSKGGPQGANPAKVLHVYGNFPAKDSKPAGK